MEVRTADRILAEGWRAFVTCEDNEPEYVAEVVAPFGLVWPGLAAVPPGPWADIDDTALRVLAEVAEDQQRQYEEYVRDRADDIIGSRPEFALGRPYRSAELPALWEERGLTLSFPYDVADVSTVLRSWEERFGTRLVGLGRDLLIVSVAAPVRTIAEAERVAAEHVAFSPDTVVQDHDAILSAYAAHQVLGSEVWSFWWD